MENSECILECGEIPEGDSNRSDRPSANDVQFLSTRVIWDVGNSVLDEFLWYMKEVVARTRVACTPSAEADVMFASEHSNVDESEIVTVWIKKVEIEDGTLF